MENILEILKDSPFIAILSALIMLMIVSIITAKKDNNE